jgi:acetyltransferase
MDINPIIVDDRGAVAVDARIVVDGVPRTASNDGWGGASGGHAGAYPHLAILPYPASLEQEWPLKGGVLATVRAVRPDDAEMLQAFVRGLSQESRYFRFASAISELPARVLSRFTLIDYDREMALVAVVKERRPGPDGAEVETERLIGVSRYITNPDGTSCEFSLVVADDFKGQGLGSRLMLSIVDLARAKGLSEIMGLILTQNSGMLRLMTSLGFHIGPCPEDPDFRVATKAL